MPTYVNGRTLRERLLSRLVITPSGCLLWTGARTGEGYGHIWTNGKMRKVHRVMWEIFAGPIPPGLVPDHLCRVRHCANVAHLELVTGRENSLRGVGQGARNAAKTHCPSGHCYDEANTYTDPNGRRHCRACGRRAQDRKRQKRRAA